MQMNFRLAFCLVGVLALAGCATGTRTEEPPVEDKTAPGAGAGTEGLGDQAAPSPGALPGTADDADLLAKRRVHFEFDSAALDEENRRIVEAHARHLNGNPNLRVQLEGHTDERGTREYNVGLGERRANSVLQALASRGVAERQLSVSSFGEERPVATGHDESAWGQNRRVEIVQ